MFLWAKIHFKFNAKYFLKIFGFFFFFLIVSRINFYFHSHCPAAVEQGRAGFTLQPLLPIFPTLPDQGPCSSLAALPCYKACVVCNQNPLSWLFSRKRPKLQHVTYFFFFFNQLLSSVSSPRVASLGAGSVPCGLSSSLGSCATEGGRGLCLCAWFMCDLESSAAETSFVGSLGHSACFPEPLQK